MSDWQSMERRLHNTLSLSRRPVGVAFCDEPPACVVQFSGSKPAGCSFWQLAAEGRTFFTIPDDHHNCAMGSYTHNMPLPAEWAQEMDQTLGLMTSIGYLSMDEVPGIPQLAKTPGAVVYAPLGDMPVEPDVVLLTGRPGKVMLVHEAAMRAGAAAQLPLLGRPTCMAVPAALTSGIVVSLGCIGNRVYTDLGDDELFVAIPGKDLRPIVDELGGIRAANAKLADYHGQRRQQLASA